MLPQQFDHLLGVATGSRDSLCEVAAIALHDQDIEREVCVDVLGEERISHALMMPGHVVQHEGATHDVACTAEHLGQAGADDIAVREQGKIREGSDGVIDNKKEIVSLREIVKSPKVRRIEKRISGKLGVQCVKFYPGSQLRGEGV
jgi:hypothetical protein